MSFLKELKRRNVTKVAVLYVVASWLILQVTEVLSSLLPVPHWTGSLVVLLLVIGFPLALIFSWVFELTPEGLKSESELDPDRSRTQQTGGKINVLIVVLLVLAIGMVAFDRLIPEADREAPAEPVTATQEEEPAETNKPRAPTAAAISLDNAQLLTKFPGSHTSPTLSPDSTFVAYVSNRSGTPQIWVQGLPDGAPIQITRGELPARSPSWSPDDDAILFERATSDGLSAVWLVDALGSAPPRVVARNAQAPRFASDGRTFVFSRGRSEIHFGTLDSDETRRLPGVPQTRGFAPVMPAINEAGDVAFVLANEGPSGNLWLYSAETDSFRQLTRSDNKFAGVWARSPAWLPGGRSIVYVAADDDPSHSHLWMVDTATGESSKLSTGVGGYEQPAVSRDGRTLLYTYARPLWRLVQTDPETGERRVIHESRSAIALPMVSPDGKTIVYFGDHVMTLPVAGGEPMQRTFAVMGEATLPAWSRSDQAIFYYKGRMLHRLDAETGQTEMVVDDFHWSSKNWLAIHGNRAAYWDRTLGEGRFRTVILDLDTGEHTVLDDQVRPTDWSRDGRTLLARSAQGGTLVLCDAPTFDCTPILHDGEPVGGAIPRWSADETRIFFRRALQGKPGFADIWVVGRDGSDLRRLVEIGPYDPRSVFFGIDEDDNIVWNEFDSLGSAEIWMAERREEQAGR